MPPPCSQENKGPAGSTFPRDHVFKSRMHLSPTHDRRLDWIDLRDHHWVLSSCFSALHCTASFSDWFRVDIQHEPIWLKMLPFCSTSKVCKKHHRASEAAHFIMVMGSGLQTEVAERPHSLQDQPRSSGGGMAC